MQFTVIRVNKFSGGNGSFKGYASVEFTDGERTLVVNGFSIITTKAGKLMARPPQTKGKDNKYYDQVTLKDQLLWDVSNAIVEEYEKGSSGQSQQGTSSGTKAPTPTGYYDPWENA